MKKNKFSIGSSNYSINTLHNQDKVIKEALEIYKGKTLDFLDEKLDGEIVEILGSEVTETITKKAYSENAFKMSTNEGKHIEWESKISKEDLMRIAAYNIDLSRKHKIPFETVIITAKPHRIKRYSNPSLTFTPRIINLKGRDADLALVQIEEKLQKGESVNELQLIYLPLYGSKSGKTVADLLAVALQLTQRVAKNKNERNKLHSLLILLCGSFIKKEDMIKILEENIMKIEGNTAIEVLHERGFEQGLTQGLEQGLTQGLEQGLTQGLEQGLTQGLEQGLTQGLEQGLEQGIVLVAKNLILRNFNFSLISEITGLSIQRLNELIDENRDQEGIVAFGS